MIIERHGIELDYCLECQGLWFNAGELTMLAAAMDEDIYLPDILNLPVSRENVLQPQYRCPRCDRKMEKFWMGEKNRILLDRCPVGDGLWFDSGELEDVISFYRQQGQSKTGALPSVSILSFVSEAFTVGA